MVGPPLTTRDVACVVADLCLVKEKWRDIGAQLALGESSLNRIQSQSPDPTIRLHIMILQWLLTAQPTWAALIEALKSRAVNEPRLAELIKQKYSTTWPTLADLGASDKTESMDQDILDVVHIPATVVPSSSASSVTSLSSTSSLTPLSSASSVTPSSSVGQLSPSEADVAGCSSKGLKRKQLHGEKTNPSATQKKMKTDDLHVAQFDPTSYSVDDFVTKQSSDLLCVRCQRVPRKPLRLKCCTMNNLHCEPCSEELKTCPIHSLMAEYTRDMPLKAKISKLTVCCMKGCNSKCAIYQMKDHLPLCKGKQLTKVGEKKRDNAKSAQITPAAVGSVGVAVPAGTPSNASAPIKAMMGSSLLSGELTRGPLKHTAAMTMEEDHDNVVCLSPPVTQPLLPPLAEVVPSSQLTPIAHFQTTPTTHLQTKPLSEVQATICNVIAIMNAANQKRSASKNTAATALPNSESTARDKKVSPKTGSSLTTPTAKVSTPSFIGNGAVPVLSVTTPSSPVTTPTIKTADTTSLKLGKAFSLHPSTKKGTAMATSSPALTSPLSPALTVSHSLPVSPAVATKIPLIPLTSSLVSATPTIGSSKVIPSTSAILLNQLALRLQALQSTPGSSSSPSLSPLQKLVETFKLKTATVTETKTDVASQKKTKGTEKGEKPKQSATTKSSKVAPVMNVKQVVNDTQSAAVTPASSQGSVGPSSMSSSVEKSKPTTSTATESLLLSRSKTHTMQPKTPPKLGVTSKTVRSKSPKAVAVEISKMKLTGAAISSASSKMPKASPSQLESSDDKAGDNIEATISTQGTTISTQGATTSTQRATVSNVQRTAISTQGTKLSNQGAAITTQETTLSNLGTTISTLGATISNQGVPSSTREAAPPTSDLTTLFDTEFTVKPRREVHCSKCKCIPRDPQRPMCNCNVLYCVSCAKVVTKCPLCSKSEGFIEDFMMKKRIWNLQVRCPYKSKGCDWKGMLSNREDHIGTCTKRNRSCKYQSLGCNDMLPVDGGNSHDLIHKDKHLQLAMDNVVMLVDQVRALQNEVDKLKEKQ